MNKDPFSKLAALDQKLFQSTVPKPVEPQPKKNTEENQFTDNLAKPHMLTIQKPTEEQIPEKKPESLISRKEESPIGRKDEIKKSGKPETLITANQPIVKARKPENSKLPKYSTQLKQE